MPEEHTHLRWCEQLLKCKFPQCSLANLETSCLLEIGDFSRKLQLRCSCQFPWRAIALKTLSIPHYLSNHTQRPSNQQWFSNVSVDSSVYEPQPTDENTLMNVESPVFLWSSECSHLCSLMYSVPTPAFIVQRGGGDRERGAGCVKKVKLSLCLTKLSITPWRHIGEWMYRSTFSWPQH
jgi:hypothetical protein